MTFFIYCTGGKLDGLGHVKRCLVLADTLRERGVEAAFVTTANTPGYDVILRGGYLPLTTEGDDASEYLSGLAQTGDSLILDIEHGPTRTTLEKLRPHYRRIITIGGVGFAQQDPQALAELVDLQIYQGELFDDPHPGNAFNGPDYLIIDPCYRACNPNLESGHIVLTMGGADPHNLTPVFAEALSGIDVPVHIVKGAANGYHLPSYPRFCVHHNLNSLETVFNGARLTICPLGMTAYESLAAGVPVLLTWWSDDHGRTALELERRGCGWRLGKWDTMTPTRVHSDVLGLLSERLILEYASDKCRALVDGHGAARVAEKICELIK